MTTITEDHVSFEIAKLLKEKGFPQEYDDYHALVYNEEDYEDEYEVQRMVLETRIVKAGTLSSYPVGVPEPKCYCPTLQMACRWLTAVHNLFITFELDFSDGAYPMFDAMIYNLATCEKYPIINYDRYSYIKGTEAAIKYCLKNLI
jgi:hypothetical protein